MSSKPKAADYKPGPDLLAQAGAALGNYQNFEQLYQPILRDMRDRNPEMQLKETSKRRADADFAQTFAGPESVRLGLVGNTEVDKARSMGSTALRGQAATQLKQAHNDQQLGVLSSARGMDATNQGAASRLASIETSNRANEAGRKLSRAQTLASAGGQLAGTFLGQGIRNMRTGGDFFNPMKTTSLNSDGSKNLDNMSMKEKAIFGLGGAFGS